MTHELTNGLLVLLGLVGVGLALWRAWPSRVRFVGTLTWLVPALILYVVAILVRDVLVGLLLGVAAIVLFGAMLLSWTANRWWSLHVLRSRDPWDLRAASVEEMMFCEEMLRHLKRLDRMDSRIAGRSATNSELDRIARERALISQLSPPNDRWGHFKSDALAQVDLVIETHAQDGVPSMTDLSAEQYGWKELRAQSRALRNDRPWPEGLRRGWRGLTGCPDGSRIPA